jgi:hypothetical protein
MTRGLPWLVAAMGAVLLGSGVLVFAVANTPDVGWTAYTAAYAPLEPGAFQSDLQLAFADGSILWTPQHALGAGFAVLGLLVLVGLGGCFLGRRSAHRTPAGG